MSRGLLNFHTLKPNEYLDRIFLKKLSTVSNYGNQKGKCDIAVVGGGIIGTSIARKLKMDHNDLQIFVLEKECSLAKHQTSHNSGVMHSGVYYQPESLKSKFCVEGIDLLQKYCDEKNINYKKCGKLIVAKDCSEVSVLEQLFERGTKNKVRDLKLLETQGDIMKIAPGCKGIKALWCPQAANVNFKEVTEDFAKDFKDLGGRVLLNTKVINILPSGDCTYPLNILPEGEAPIQAKYAVTCGGLQSESLTKLVNEYSLTNQSFVALKVEYHKIEGQYCDGVETNIYAVPDLTLPFLGAHFSPQMDNFILLGPYATPAFKPEGYCFLIHVSALVGHYQRSTRQYNKTVNLNKSNFYFLCDGISIRFTNNNEVNLTYVSKILTSCSLRNFILKNFSKCVTQALKAICSEVQIKHLQELVPNFSYQFVEKGPTGVQCQLINNDGTVVDDFVFEFFNGKGIGQRIINIKFTPSPAATSSLSIADYVAKEFTRKFHQR